MNGFPIGPNVHRSVCGTSIEFSGEWRKAANAAW
jgi:hypothetical protein